MNDRARHVLVTGATGGLGRAATRLLLARGATVRATGRDPTVGSALARAGAEFFARDLCRSEEGRLETLTRGVDAVWHCAAMAAPTGSRAQFMDANVSATGRLLDAAGRAGVRRFVFISSPAVYFGYHHRLNVTEDQVAARSAGDYASSKLLAEDLVRHAGVRYPHMRCVILRPRAIFGPHDRVLLPRLLRMHARLKGTLLLPRAGRTLIDLTYVDNVVHAMELACSAPALPQSAAYNVTNGEPVRIADALESLFRALGRPCRLRSLPYPMLAAASFFDCSAAPLGRYGAAVLAYDMVLDGSRAARELGYVPQVGLDAGIRETARSLVHHD